MSASRSGDGGGGAGHVSDKYTAGFRLLNKFEAQWEQLHGTSERNANKAHIALAKLKGLNQSCSRRLDAINMFNESYKSLSMLEERINNISCDLSKLEEYIVVIEEYLITLKDIEEQNDANRFILSINGNHEAQVQQEKIQSELRKDRLMTEHLKRVQDFESNQQSLLEERRRVLERQFEEEKSRYLDKNKRP